MNTKGIITGLLLTAGATQAQETTSRYLPTNKQGINTSQQLVSGGFAHIQDTTSVYELMQYVKQLSKKYCKKSYSEKCLIKVSRGEDTFEIIRIPSSSTEQLLVSYVTNSAKDIDQIYIAREQLGGIVTYHGLRTIYEKIQHQIRSINEIFPEEYRTLIATTENLDKQSQHILKTLRSQIDK